MAKHLANISVQTVQKELAAAKWHGMTLSLAQIRSYLKENRHWNGPTALTPGRHAKKYLA